MNDKASQVQIPGFRIIRELGRGGMASVYLAMQESLDREVALKIMAPSLLAVDDDFSRRFVNEGKTIAKLNHPNVVTVYDIAATEGHHYIAMEYIDGENLKSRIRRGLPPNDGVEIVKQVAAALGYAHKKGFVHRDVKPDNILLRENGAAVLTDFGIAKTMGEVTRMTATGMSIGTPHYMSPEQIRGGNVDFRSDLYSLGVVLYEVLTNQPPFDATDSFALGLKHISEPVPRLPSGLAHYQPVLDRLLAKEPQQRHRNAETLAKALAEATKTSAAPIGGAVEATEVLPRVQADVRTSSALKVTWLSSGVAAIALILAVIAYINIGSDSMQSASGDGGDVVTQAAQVPLPDSTSNSVPSVGGDGSDVVMEAVQTSLPDSNNDVEIVEVLVTARDLLEVQEFDEAQIKLDEARAMGADGEEIGSLERRLQELRTRRTLAEELLGKAKAALDMNRLSEAQSHCESARGFFSGLIDEGVCAEVEQRRTEVKKQWQQQNVGTQGTTQVR